MDTVVFSTELDDAARMIKNGGLVAVPTETVYGLAGNGLDADSVRKIYEVKGRPAVKPLSLMVEGEDDMERFCLDVCHQAHVLAEKYWPGPLTIVMKSRPFIPDIVLAGGKTVGLRCPASPQTLKLIHLAGVPLAAPSANPSGEPSPKSAEKVLEYFNGLIDGVIDGGTCSLGVESTLIDMTAAPYRILRRGALSETEIADTLVEGMAVFGITGPTGAGKTTALSVLSELGAVVIDCDAVYHELLDRDDVLLSALESAFPDAFNADGLDRKALGSIVFSNPEELNRLNRITHDRICGKVLEILREQAMCGKTVAAIDAVELLSSGLAGLCDRTFAVVADREVRTARIMARDHISREDALRRVDAQKPLSYYSERADIILENNSGETEFKDLCFNCFTEEISNG